MAGKGNPKTGGRRTGTPNRATAEAREAIALFVEGNADKLQEWLDQIAQKDPQAAFRCFMDVVEYHIPKLARQEITGTDGGPVEHRLIENVIVDPKG